MTLLRVILVAVVLYVLWRAFTTSRVMIRSGRFARRMKRKLAATGEAPEAIRPPHEVLGISKSASAEEARRAYLALVRQVHPDRSSELSPELKRLAEARTKELNQAYDAVVKKR